MIELDFKSSVNYYSIGQVYALDEDSKYALRTDRPDVHYYAMVISNNNHNKKLSYALACLVECTGDKYEIFDDVIFTISSEELVPAKYMFTVDNTFAEAIATNIVTDILPIIGRDNDNDQCF